MYIYIYIPTQLYTYLYIARRSGPEVRPRSAAPLPREPGAALRPPGRLGSDTPALERDEQTIEHISFRHIDIYNSNIPDTMALFSAGDFSRSVKKVSEQCMEVKGNARNLRKVKVTNIIEETPWRKIKPRAVPPPSRGSRTAAEPQDSSRSSPRCE